MEVAVPQSTSCTSQRLSTHNPVTSTFLYCCRRSRTAFWVWTTCSSRDAGLPVQPWWPTTAIPAEPWCSTETFTRLRIDWTELLSPASERIRLGPASVTESTKSTSNRFCRYWITGSWTRPSMQLMAVQNLTVSVCHPSPEGGGATPEPQVSLRGGRLFLPSLPRCFGFRKCSVSREAYIAMGVG